MPGLRFVDAASGALGIEWVNGKSVRSLLGSGDEGEEISYEEDEDVALTEDEDLLAEYGVPKGMSYLIPRPWTVSFPIVPLDALMVMVGTEIAKMHLADIIHGDLTTSNMMLRQPSSVPNSLGIQQLVRDIITLSHPPCVNSRIRFSLTLGWPTLLR